MGRNGLTDRAADGTFDGPEKMNDLVFVAGSNRSGTTWLAELINYASEYDYCFEPFHPKQVSLFSGFSWRQYIETGDKSPRFTVPVDRLLGEGLRNSWTDQFNRNPSSGRRLIKAIRANLFLAWLRERYPQVKIVFILRHPCAVAASKIRLNWPDGRNVFANQPALVERHLSHVDDLLKEECSLVNRHVISWAVENLVPLQTLQPDTYHLVFYEDLCLHGERELEKLFAFLERRYEPGALAALRRPSKLARQGSAILTGSDPVTSWQRYIPSAQLASIDKILHRFNLERVYTADNPLPRLSSAFSQPNLDAFSTTDHTAPGK